MVLDSKTADKIKAFVYQKPRTILEIAQMLGKSWKTADRYVGDVIEQEGNIGIRVFRGGTRGALKIVYWDNIERIYSTRLQEQILKIIERGLEKTDFYFSDIYQYVDSKKRRAYVEKRDNYDWLAPMLNKAQNEILLFSGNGSWVNRKGVVKTLESLSTKNCTIRVLVRIDLVGIKNIERLLTINDRMKKDFIEVRHVRQPLRGVIIDEKIGIFKDVLMASNKVNEIQEDITTYYEIHDKYWIQWLKNVFFKKFQSGIPATKRLEDLNSIKK